MDLTPAPLGAISLMSFSIGDVVCLTKIGEISCRDTRLAHWKEGMTFIVLSSMFTMYVKDDQGNELDTFPDSCWFSRIGLTKDDYEYI